MLTIPTTLSNLPEIIDGLPNISGWETEVLSVVNHDQPVFLPNNKYQVRGCKCCICDRFTHAPANYTCWKWRYTHQQSAIHV